MKASLFALSLFVLCAGCGGLKPYLPSPPAEQNIPQLLGDRQLHALTAQGDNGQSTAEDTEAALLARAEALRAKANAR